MSVDTVSKEVSKKKQPIRRSKREDTEKDRLFIVTFLYDCVDILAYCVVALIRAVTNVTP